MKEDIKKLYKALDNKSGFVTDLAEKLGKEPKSVYNHWFCGFWSIPKEYLEVVLNELKESTKDQTALKLKKTKD